jgi:hypothetical protein
MFSFPFYDIECFPIPEVPKMKVPERFVSRYGSRMTDVFMRYDKLLYSSKPSKSNILNGSVFPKIDSRFSKCKTQHDYRDLYNKITENIDVKVKLELVSSDDKVHVLFRYEPQQDKICDNEFQYIIKDLVNDSHSITKYKKFEDYYVLYKGRKLADLTFDEILNDYVSYEANFDMIDHVSDITWYIFKHGNFLSNECMIMIIEAYKNIQKIEYSKIFPDSIINPSPIINNFGKSNEIHKSKCYITHFSDEDCDISKWCAESIFLGNSKNLNERSKLSEMTSMYILNKYFGAKTARSECDVRYWNDFWKKCDYITKISNKPLAISVSRMNGPAYFYMPTRIRMCIGALELLYKKIYGLVVARSGIVEKVSFDYSILHVFVPSHESALCVSFVFDQLGEEIKSDIALIVTVIKVSNRLFSAKFFH